MLTDEDVISAVQQALRQLYDTQALRENPLVSALGLAKAPNAASELRRILTDAIRTLRPSGDVPPEAGSWRIHEILEYRYLQQVGQAELARQLGLSVRHLRREERRAAEALAQQICPRLVKASGVEAFGTEEAEAEAVPQAVDEELAWLDGQVAPPDINLSAAIREVVSVASPLAEARKVIMHLDLPVTELHAAVQPVALREIVLQLLTAAICHSASSPVTVRACSHGNEAAIEIDTRLAGEHGISKECDAAITMARQLATRCGVDICTTVDDQTLEATILLPLPQGVPVLVIEDNEDTVRLLRRFVAGTPFQIQAAESISQALEIAAQTRPRIIVLDVMMPHMDGWEMLGQLRHHPLTMNAPIIVCSILTQAELALSLGASDYIRKPVTAQTFVQALEQALRQEAPTRPSTPPYTVAGPAG